MSSVFELIHHGVRARPRWGVASCRLWHAPFARVSVGAMDFYSRRQLVLLLIVLAIAGIGLGVGRWRRSHPDLAGRLEQIEAAIDRNGGTDATETAATGSRPARRGGSGRAQSETTVGEPDGEGRKTPGVAGEDRRRPRSKLATGDEGATHPLDLNRATAMELTRLPGVGPVLAERILAARIAAGVFASLEDLRRVRGLGRVKLERLRALVTVAEAGLVDATRDPLVH